MNGGIIKVTKVEVLEYYKQLLLYINTKKDERKVKVAMIKKLSVCCYLSKLDMVILCRNIL